MKLLKHILLTLLICFISACSGSKMEPIGDDPFLNNDELDGELSLGDDSDNPLTLGDGQDSGELSLAPEIPEPPPPNRRPASSAASQPNRPTTAAQPQRPQATCPTCPASIPAPVQSSPCQFWLPSACYLSACCTAL